MLFSAFTAYGATIELGTPRMVDTGGAEAYFPVVSVDGTALRASVNGKEQIVVDLQNGNIGALTQDDVRFAIKSTRKGVTVATTNDDITITRNGIKKTLKPVENTPGYLWASVSPDNSKVVFLAAGKGVMVMDLNGNILANLGNYQRPCWLNDEFVVCQNASDDGHQFKASQIVIINVKSGEVTEVTGKNSFAMHPSCNGKVIAYDTIDGRIFTVDVTLK